MSKKPKKKKLKTKFNSKAKKYCPHCASWVAKNHSIKLCRAWKGLDH